MHIPCDELTHFARAIRGQELPGELADSMGAGVRSVAAGVDVYRNNYRGNLHDALAATYPVTVQLVGEEFFRMLARDYIRNYPSFSGNLCQYGEGLPRFVASYTPAQSVPYLADVAQLEWACHRAYFADDVAPLDVAKLAQVAPQHYTHLRLILDTACCVVRSPYPIAVIWQAHQPGQVQQLDIDISSGACCALVCRRQNAVEVHELSAAAADWIGRIQADVPLGQATDATCALYPEFDLQAALLQLVMQGGLAGFELTLPLENP